MTDHIWKIRKDFEKASFVRYDIVCERCGWWVASEEPDRATREGFVMREDQECDFRVIRGVLEE